jgi:hypothetical protein
MGRWTHVTSAPRAASPGPGPAETPDPRQAAGLAAFEAKLAELAAREREHVGRKNMWLAHHWPEHYAERCIVLGGRHVCRRCASLYPLGLLVAVLSAGGSLPWPDGVDPAAIWLLSIPATVAYCAEAVGLIAYRPWVQVTTTLLAALAFGRALGYELLERWSPEFWGPVAVFGGIWFFATTVGLTRKRVARLR